MFGKRRKGSPSTLLSACQVMSAILCPKLTWKVPSGEILLSGKKQMNKKKHKTVYERMEGKAEVKPAKTGRVIRKSVLQLKWKY